MWLLAAGLMVLSAGAILSLLCQKAPRLSTALGAGSAIAGSVLALLTAAQVLYSGRASGLTLPWQVPFARFTLEVDPLSAAFLLPIAVVVAVAALYGMNCSSIWAC